MINNLFDFFAQIDPRYPNPNLAADSMSTNYMSEFTTSYS